MTDTASPFSALIQSREKDLGDFSVRRLLPHAKQTMVGPWIFFDHMGPAEFAPGQGIQVRPHPHINLATVTYLFEGEIFHRDSLGSAQIIRPGDLNLMVAGRGITHSERTTPETLSSGQRLHGLQLWLALPEDQEEIDPAFYHYPQNEMPKTEMNGVALRVMMGSAYGLSSPVKTFAKTLYVEAHLQTGQSLTLPEEDQLAVYIAQGTVTANNNSDKADLATFTLAVLNARDDNTDPMPITLTATSESRIAIIGGETLSERHIEWNFVSSRKERIEQAKADWQAQRFAKVPGDEKEFIPLP